MILLPTLEFHRRDFIQRALGSAVLLAAPVPVLVQRALAQPTGGPAVTPASPPAGRRAGRP
jgi:hypothetical protein